MALEKFFSPNSVAIVGASADTKKVGHVILKNFAERYTGRIYPVNLQEKEILGLKCHPSVSSIRDKIDMAVIAVPPAVANSVVKECVEKKIEAVVVITAGYKEIGTAEGVLRENELEKIVEGTKTRIVGPNCLGILDTETNVDTMFLPEYKMDKAVAGNIALISQSGAFASALLDWFFSEGIGISKFVSYGNRTDVDEPDLLEFLLHDKKTKCIVMYIEGPKDGRELMATLKKVTKQKPVVVLKSGKSTAGIKAAASHTGSLAGSYPVFRGMLRQAGAVEAETLDDAFDYAKIFSTQPAMKGKRVAIVTNGGGYGILCADACTEECLELAELSDRTKREIKKVLPSYSSLHNPVDLIGDANADRYRATLDALALDPEVDAIVVVSLFQTSSLGPEVVDVISGISRTRKKPVVVCATGGAYTGTLVKNLEESGVPVFKTPNRTLKALRALYTHSRNR